MEIWFVNEAYHEPNTESAYQSSGNLSTGKRLLGGSERDWISTLV